MAKSAQQRFNEYLDECQQSHNVINELNNSTNDLYGSYAYAAGFLGMTLADAISELPKAKRAEFRDRILKAADRAKHEFLLKTIKEAA